METLLSWPAAIAGAFLFVWVWWSPEANVARRAYQLALTVLTIRYALWRWTETLPLFRADSGTLLIYGFFGLELLSLFLFVRQRSVLSSTISRSSEADEGTGWHLKLPQPPLIDVFVPTYNESWQILEKTFVGLRLLEYPRLRVWVLDDGRREWLAQASATAGFNYLTRPDNAHFKAGNLNHALAHVRSLPKTPNFIAVFDADFVAQPRFIDRTLALMANEKVAIVQTPQTFYNPDPFQFGLLAERSWPDEQRFLFDVRMPSADAKGGAQCCGTSFLLRVEALDAIGGHFPTDTICEDTMTSVMLSQKGWKTVYLMERLSAGLNAEGLEEFLKQRSRWCLGGVQISQWSLRSARGLVAKLTTLEGMLRWAYQSFMQLLWLALPISFWLSGFSLLHAGPAEIVRYVLPMSLVRTFSAWITRRTQMPIITDSMTLMLAPTAIKATLVGLLPNRKHTFRVTNKGLNRSGVIVHWRVLIGSASALILLVGGMLYRTFVVRLTNTDVDGYSFWNYYVACQQSVVLLAVLLVSIERPRLRPNDRYAADEAVTVTCAGADAAARLVDISLTGLRIRTQAPLELGQQLQLLIHDVGQVAGTVIRRPADQEYGIKLELGALREKMIQKIYCTSLCIPDKPWAAMPAVCSIFRRLGGVLWGAARSMLSFRTAPSPLAQTRG